MIRVKFRCIQQFWSWWRTWNIAFNWRAVSNKLIIDILNWKFWRSSLNYSLIQTQVNFCVFAILNNPNLNFLETFWFAWICWRYLALVLRLFKIHWCKQPIRAWIWHLRWFFLNSCFIFKIWLFYNFNFGVFRRNQLNFRGFLFF